jgi:hypothetical protein
MRNFGNSSTDNRTTNYGAHPVVGEHHHHNIAHTTNIEISLCHIVQNLLSNMTRDNRDDAKTIHESKEMFVAAINQGMDALMNDCGYSRERAAMVLLRELQRSGADCKKKPTVSSFRPTDDEVCIWQSKLVVLSKSP